MTKRIYMDHAATTPLHPEVLAAMMPYLTELYGNPSSIHSFGRETRQAIDTARDTIAENLGAADASEIIFTGSGSESDNFAIKGTAFALKEKGNHIITSAIEHHAVLDTCKWLEKQGFRVTYLPVDAYGLVDPARAAKAITNETILMSVHYANNEIGTIEPIEELGEIARAKGILFHTDAVQAIGSLPLRLKDMPVDMVSFSAHKFYGPKGIGGLYLRKGTRPIQLIHGGAQERNRRAGTENVAGIVGMAEALKLALNDMEARNIRIAELRDRLIQGVFNQIDHVRLNGHPARRLPGNSSFCFQYIEGESLLLNLDLQGIAGSSGSACTSGSLEPSHVLLALGLSHEIAHGSLRLTLGSATTSEEIDHILAVLPGIVAKLRDMSPLFNVKGVGEAVCTAKK
ncbi:MAG TPA: cysteine desulfurase NifS [Firmicutes bacterium]|nr:cysteine desulfurase NifS [Bacillota bacterium]HBL69529.1 cysteine desulfurase NifS [Bacillota bacterium]HCF92166.1 cysteine desulfurase NifS [Bacillota bacterium]